MAMIIIIKIIITAPARWRGETRVREGSERLATQTLGELRIMKRQLAVGNKNGGSWDARPSLSNTAL